MKKDEYSIEQNFIFVRMAIIASNIEVSKRGLRDTLVNNCPTDTAKIAIISFFIKNS